MRTRMLVKQRAQCFYLKLYWLSFAKKFRIFFMKKNILKVLIVQGQPVTVIYDSLKIELLYLNKIFLLNYDCLIKMGRGF